MEWQATAAGAVFALAFLLLAVGRIGRGPVPRGAVGLVGGLVTMVLLGLDWGVVDAEVLLLLAGLMALAAMADATGLRAPLQAMLWLVPAPWALPAACAFMAMMSAVLLNDAAVVVLVPLLLPELRSRGVPAVAGTVWLAVSANVGSLLTPFGNPQNTVLARAGGMDVVSFALQQALVFIAAMALVLVIARRQPRDETGTARPRREDPVTEHPVRAPRGQAQLAALAVLGFVAWAVWWPERLGTGAALAAAAAFVLLRPRHRGLERRVARGIDLNVLTLFVGLYLLTAGIDAWLPAGSLEPSTWGPVRSTTTVVLVANMVGNVPTILALEGIDGAWVAAHAPFLVSASTLGGSLLLTGSAATLLAVESARRQGVEVSFAAFARRAALPMGAATAAAAWWMW